MVVSDGELETKENKIQPKGTHSIYFHDPVTVLKLWFIFFC